MLTGAPRRSLIMCTWGSGGAWALQVPTQTSFHGPVKADAGLKVVEYDSIRLFSSPSHRSVGQLRSGVVEITNTPLNLAR